MPRLFLLLLGIVSAPALGQRVAPTDTDLRAAYCVGVLHYQAQVQQTAVDSVYADIAKLGSIANSADAGPRERLMGLAKESERKLRDTQARLDRVMAFVTPRLAYLDPAPIVSATKQADADISALQAKSCPAECVKERACVERERADPDIGARFKPCEQVTWLPSY